MSANEPTKPPSLLKWIGIPVLLAVAFMGVLYLAIENEPHYMPAQQKKAQGVDLHAKHANAQNPQTTDESEHASHSAEEHTEAVATEHQQH